VTRFLQRLKVRYLLPLLLFGILPAHLAQVYFFELPETADALGQEAASELLETMNRSQGTFNRLFRTKNREGVRQEVSFIATRKGVELVLVLDEYAAPIAASRYELVQEFPREALSPEEWRLGTQAMEEMRSVHLLDKRHHRVTGMIPLQIGEEVDQIRASRLGLLIIRYDYDWQYTRFERAIYRELLIEILILAVASLIFFLISTRLLSRPITRLAQASAKLAKGDYRVDIRPEGAGELSQLAETMAAMADAIQERERELREAHRGLEQKVRERTRELEAAKKEAEAANLAKSVFLSSMSHELRTPMNAILGFAQLMQRDPTLKTAQRGNLETINRSGQHLLALINDVLEISRIEAGRAERVDSAFDFHEFLLGIEEMLRLRAEAKDIALYVELGELPHYVENDENKLRQILINLMGNAVKFTDSGSVTLSVEAGKVEGETQPVTFRVKDTGVGIAAEEMDKIFEPFGQTKTGKQRSEGSGLGLTICRKFVQLLGGEVSVTSELGKGSEFSFTLPMKPLEEAGLPQVETPLQVIGLEAGQPEYRILVVEDKPDNRLLLRDLLQQVGFQVLEAVNGEEAITRFKEEHPDLICMDMRMPVMDGYEATRLIKAMPEGRETPIIALTASAFEEDREAVMACGCDGFVRKPLKEHRLFDAITRLLGVRFRYQDQAIESRMEAPLDQRALAQLPKALLERLLEAAEQLDSEEIEKVVAEIEIQSAPLAGAIRDLAMQFRFDVVINAVQSATNREVS
jgi:signal transduction histidine kinase/DNA-binding NarL/FixJ family response regulator